MVASRLFRVSRTLLLRLSSALLITAKHFKVPDGNHYHLAALVSNQNQKVIKKAKDSM